MTGAALSPATLHSSSSMGHFLHTQCIPSWLSILFWGICEYACLESEAWLPGWELTSMFISFSIYQSFSHSPSGAVLGTPLSELLLCEWQSKWVCFQCHQGGLFPEVQNFISDKKAYMCVCVYACQRQSDSIFPLFKAGGKS